MQTKKITFCKLRFIYSLVFSSLVTMSSVACAADSFVGLGTLGGIYSYAFGISADGKVIFGTSDNGNYSEAFRWSAAGGMQGLGGLGTTGFGGNAWGASADGAVIVGDNLNVDGNLEATIWTHAGGLQGLGFLGTGARSQSSAVSWDGEVVVGESNNGTAVEAFRWTSTTGMQGLGFLVGGDSSFAYGISGDGTVIVGKAGNGANSEAFRWTDVGGMQGLGFLPGNDESYAYGASFDGSVVVGGGRAGGAGWEAFRWTNSGGMVSLGLLPGGSESFAYVTSADGSVSVGFATNNTGNYEAVRWSTANGIQTITQWLSDAGVAQTPGWQLLEATGISADGTVVSGGALNPSGNLEAWVARVSPIGSGIINPSVITQSAQATSVATIQTAATMPNLTLFGAHHRSILDNGLAKSTNGECAWTVGDIAGHHQNDTRMALTEVGWCKDLDSMRIGIGLGQVWVKQEWDFSGKAKYSGQYMIAEGAKLFENGLQPSVIAYYGQFDTTLSRNYQNGGNIDTSKGSPDITSKALKLRVDWKGALTGSAELSPYVAYTWMRSSIESYTESGGGFPIRFSRNQWNTNDIRLGVTSEIPVNQNTNVVMAAELAHRLEGSSAGSSGQVLGLWSFDVKGRSQKQNWTHVSADVDHRFSDSLLGTLGLSLAGGGDPDWGVTAALKVRF